MKPRALDKSQSLTERIIAMMDTEAINWEELRTTRDARDEFTAQLKACNDDAAKILKLVESNMFVLPSPVSRGMLNSIWDMLLEENPQLALAKLLAEMKSAYPVDGNIHFLLRKGADPFFEINDQKQTPLYLAVRENKTEWVKWIAEIKGDDFRKKLSDPQSPCSNTKLFLAAVSNNKASLEMVKMIGDMDGFDVNAVGDHQDSALHHIVRNDADHEPKEIAEELRKEAKQVLYYLLNRDIDVALKNDLGETALQIAYERSRRNKPPADQFRHPLILAEHYAKVKNKSLAQQVETILTADLASGYGTSIAHETHAKKPPVDAELLQAIKNFKSDPGEIRKYLNDPTKKIDPTKKEFIETVVFKAPKLLWNELRTERRQKSFFLSDRRMASEKEDEVNPLATPGDIKKALESYISRIEGYRGDKANPEDTTINFREGFWFMKDSRAKNRQANYKLARDLLVELNAGKPIEQVFDPDNIKYLRRDFDPTRNIHSADLNRIIQAVGKIIHTQTAGGKLKK